jgi:purine-binding chemotaxis protein CheW
MDLLREAPAPAGEFIGFMLDDARYGFDMHRVREIRSYETPTRMAGMPAFVKGVLNLRGALVPILDLRPLLSLAQRDDDSRSVVIVLDAHGRSVGAMVDSVSEVVEAAWPGAAAQAGALVAGVTRAEGRGMVLLDIDALMQRSECAACSA